MIKILNGNKEVIQKNIAILAKDYFEKTGKKVCRTCPSDIRYMILVLKNHYKMTNFKFGKPAVQYKNKKGDKTTISNSTMTDKKAIEFLKTNPERIKLFSVYPKNWKKLIEGKKETKKEKEARLLLEAELAGSDKDTSKKDSEDTSGEGETEEQKQERLAVEAASEAVNESDSGEQKPTEEELLKMQLKDLRKAYPEVRATSVQKFVELVLK